MKNEKDTNNNKRYNDYDYSLNNNNKKRQSYTRTCCASLTIRNSLLPCKTCSAKRDALPMCISKLRMHA